MCLESKARLDAEQITDAKPFMSVLFITATSFSTWSRTAKKTADSDKRAHLRTHTGVSSLCHVGGDLRGRP